MVFWWVLFFFKVIVKKKATAESGTATFSVARMPKNHLVILNQNQEMNCQMTLGVKEILIPKILEAVQLVVTKSIMVS